MAYSDFTMKRLEQEFGLTIVEREDLFGSVSPVATSASLREMLHEYVPLARAINTEKARSELLVMPLLVETRRLLNHEVSLFSGVDFPASPERGLDGVCDFLVSRSPQQQYVSSPVAAIVEAKNENLKSGLAQCIASMLGAQLFNERETRPTPRVYGGVTSGTAWRFLVLEGTFVLLDQRDYYVTEFEQVVGILAAMAQGTA